MLPIHFSHFLFGQCQRRVTWKGTAIMQNLLELCFAPGSILFQQVFALICELSVSPKIWLISVISWSVCNIILARRDLFKAMPLGLFHIQVKSNVITVLFLRQGKISQWEFQKLTEADLHHIWKNSAQLEVYFFLSPGEMENSYTLSKNLSCNFFSFDWKIITIIIYCEFSCDWLKMELWFSSEC